MSAAQMAVAAEDVATVLAEVWESFIGEGESERAFPVEPSGLERSGRPDVVGARIALRGDWSGRVDVLTSRAGADMLARAMWKLPEGSEPGGEDVEDALGEVVNVVGGNVKAIGGGGGRLGLPHVELGGAPPLEDADAVEVCRTALEWRGEPVEVVVTGLPGAAQQHGAVDNGSVGTRPGEGGAR